MSSSQPLVSVICLCYNQEKYVEAAINSVINQSYSNIELIVVDDASTDGSQDVISSLCEKHPEIKLLLLDNNLGNCAAFNRGWQIAQGKYIIDLAADDIIYSERVSYGVERLEMLGEEYGVHFTDVKIINEEGEKLYDHFTHEFYKPVPEGYIFKELLSKYFINPVSMMISNKVLEELDGYDELLAYEDFDFWVRSSKQFKYCYSPEILVAKRKLKNSHSSGQYRFKSKMLESTLMICAKAFKLCTTKDEFTALRMRINYEMRKSFQSFNLRVGFQFFLMRQKVMSRIKELS